MNEITTQHTEAINDLCEIVNDWATSKGWNETQDSVEHKMGQLMLMVTEIAECAEFIRQKGLEYCPHCPSTITEYVGLELDSGPIWLCNMCNRQFVGRLPDQVPAQDDKVTELTGEEVELADLVIRVFHYCGKRNIDLGRAIELKHKFNITRPYKHGKKC